MTWWESWFGEEYLDLYPHRDVDSARREVDLRARAPAPQPTPLLDLCCGSGRHSSLFPEPASRRSGSTIRRRCSSSPAGATGRSRLVRGDMRSLPFPDGAFAAVVNFFTSFGYFVGETENVAVVAEIERVLARGRRVPLRHLRPRPRSRAARRRRSADCCGEKEYRIRRCWNPESQRIEKEIEVRRDGSTEIFRESVRAYTRGGARHALLEAAGLRVESDVGRLRRNARSAPIRRA